MRPISVLVIAIILASSCQKDSKQTPNIQKQITRSQEQSSQIVVEKLNEAGLRGLISQRNGKLLLLNVWATWCLPCREEFPDLVKLADEYQRRDVEVVGLSVDYPDEIETKIVPFLKAVRANFRIFVQDFNDPAVLIQQLDANWSGALPATFIFDKKGSRQAVLVGLHSYERFKGELEKYLAEQ